MELNAEMIEKAMLDLWAKLERMPAPDMICVDGVFYENFQKVADPYEFVANQAWLRQLMSSK